MFDEPLKVLQEQLINAADPVVKSWWENYVKESAPFMGVKMPEIRTIVHEWYKENVASQLNYGQKKDLGFVLLKLTHTEEKLAGILFFSELMLPAGLIKAEQEIHEFAALFEAGYIYDWNVCDWFCVKVLGPLIKIEGDYSAKAISDWHQEQNLWQARASLIAFVNLVRNDHYYDLINSASDKLIRREERFVKTAVGWILREISRVDGVLVHQFLNKNLKYFSIESLNNALKYFDPESKKMYKKKWRALVK